MARDDRDGFYGFGAFGGCGGFGRDGYPPSTQPPPFFGHSGRRRFRRVRFQTPSSVSFSGLAEFRGACQASQKELLANQEVSEYGFLYAVTSTFFGHSGRIRFRRVRFQTPSSVSFSGLAEFRGASSVSSFRPIICVQKRTHRVCHRTHRVCHRTQ